jgi:adenine-specific DNA-methyltransferase
MSADRTWLYRRLVDEPITDSEQDRWKTILARLRRLTEVDESTIDLMHGSRNWSHSSRPKVAENHRHQSFAGAREQGEGGGRTATNSPQSVVRRDVDALREIEAVQDTAMIKTERQLAAVAAALLGKAKLSTCERALVPRSGTFQFRKLASIRANIRSGDDPLGELFSEIRSPEDRRKRGATYTPNAIVEAMIAWAAAETTPPARIVDPGAGSGRFLMAAAKVFPKAKLIAVDVDPLAALMIRANAAVLGFSNRLSIELVDYRALKLPHVGGPTLFIGNPPYVRHHNIDSKWKKWFAGAARDFGISASGLAGLHMHFFVKTRQLARAGDFGAFITAAEWLDVNYGSVLRHMLADGLGGTALHVIDPKALPFSDTFTTGAITCFRVGRRPDQLTIRMVDSLAKLAPLSAGRGMEWSKLEAASRWSPLFRPGAHARPGEIELGELFRVHRGQVTGCNVAWIAAEQASALPPRFLFPTVTKARELLIAGHTLESSARLRKVIDLPIDLDELTPAERSAVDEFLTWAKRIKADKSFIATHRRAWWSVGLRAPAPILCTYMARRAPAFVRNLAGARLLNIAHGLYPRDPLTERDLMAILMYLRRHTDTTGGRVYAGGLVKFEPKELERIPLPRVEDIHGYLAESKGVSEKVVPQRVAERRDPGPRRIS